MKQHTWFFAALAALAFALAFASTAIAQTNCVVLGSVAHCPSDEGETDQGYLNTLIALAVVLTIVAHTVGQAEKEENNKNKQATFGLEKAKPSAFSVEPIIEQNRFGGRLVWRF